MTMKRIALDGEWKLDQSRIWVFKTIDVDTGEIRTWKEANSFRAYIEDATLVIAHNGISSDFRVLMKLWNTKMTMPVFDTLVVSKLLKPNREGGHSLDSWGERLGNPKLNYPAVWAWMMDRKEEYKGECYDNPIPHLLDYYCGRDVLVLRDVFFALEKEWKASGFSQESFELEHEVAEIIAQQMDNGFKLDVANATMLLADLKGKMGDIYDAMQAKWPPYTVERISEKTGKKLKDGVVTFNPGSRKQVAAKLKEMGWKPTKFTETGAPQMDESVLTTIDIPEAKEIRDYFIYQKLIGLVESWFKNLDKDGRVRGYVDALGTATGRMSHSGPNMAQVPAVEKRKNKETGKDEVLTGLEGGYGPECRECWTVEEGNILVGADASGLELRMLAHFMNDPSYTQTVVAGSSKNGTDVHTVNMKAAGLTSRDDAKTFIYAFLYGAGDAKIGSIVGGTAKDGKALKDRFLKGLPALMRVKKGLEKSCERGYCMGLDGRKIWIASDHSSLNYLLQGGGAIVMKKALVLADRKLKASGIPYRWVVNVHDEFQCEIPDGYGDTVGSICVESIREAGEHFTLKCPLDGEYKTGKSWRETH